MFKDDYYRKFGTKKVNYIKMVTNKELMYIFLFRLEKKFKSKILKKLINHKRNKIGGKRGIEIPSSVIVGNGMIMIHPYCITINSKAVIGKNVTLLKGCTIGNQKRGKKAGSPILGNDVYVGLNSTIVGAVTIGNDVLIAPNSYVNFDVPDHSIVIGNPGKIYRKDNATELYINNRI